MSKYNMNFVLDGNNNISCSYQNPADGSVNFVGVAKSDYHAGFRCNVGGTIEAGLDLKSAVNPEREYDEYFSRFKTIIESVFANLIIKGSPIRDIWKLPDPDDCLLYAITEASEYLEAAILQVRTTDSRNNKKLEDYDLGTEMFDFTMMLMRYIISVCDTFGMDCNTIEGQNLTARYFWALVNLHIAARKEELLTAKFNDNHLNLFYRQQPYELVDIATVVAEYGGAINDKWENPKEFNPTLRNLIFTAFEYVVFNPFMLRSDDLLDKYKPSDYGGFLDYEQIAFAKLDKIYNKSMAKMKERENE